MELDGKGNQAHIFNKWKLDKENKQRMLSFRATEKMWSYWQTKSKKLHKLVSQVVTDRGAHQEISTGVKD